MAFKRIDAPKLANASMQPAFDKFFLQSGERRWLRKGIARMLPLAEDANSEAHLQTFRWEQKHGEKTTLVFSSSSAIPRGNKIATLNESIELQMPAGSNIASIGELSNETYLLATAIHLLMGEKSKKALQNKASIPLLVFVSTISLGLFAGLQKAGAVMMGVVFMAGSIAQRWKRVQYLEANYQKILSDFIAIAAKKEEVSPK